ncbi:MAG: GNAT family N-acetyltransferase [Cyclobacteriaceae bacterium]|nr:GNAT family N-acetyltransferase [Cyclobacteriaceae bacterium]
MELIQGRLILRPIRYDDKESLAKLANNKKIWLSLRDTFPLPYRIADAENFIEMTKNFGSWRVFAITYDYEFCGVISLILQHDVYCKSAEIGYWLGESYWNKGIASTAVSLLTTYGFEDLALERIFAAVFSGNQASIRVLEKCAFRQEGLFRKAVFKNNVLLDELRFARLKGE